MRKQFGGHLEPPKSKTREKVGEATLMMSGVMKSKATAGE